MSVFGVWMWPHSVHRQGARAVIARCARIGITDIFFLTKGLAGTSSYPSAFVPAFCERDLLRELLDAAHTAGIRVHAWLTSASDAHYKSLHPESGRVHITRGADKALISLTDEAYLTYMQRVVTELCTGYAIDGLHIDYIRYNHLLYGWSEDDCARYTAAGADMAHLRTLMERTFLRDDNNEPDCIFDAFRAGDRSVLALAEVRRRDVVHFAKTLTCTARAVRPDLPLSAALMPEGAYEDTAFSDLHYGQNYEDAAALYDFVLPMAYSQAYGQDGAWVRRVAEGTHKRGLKTIMGLHAYEGGTGVTLKADIAALDGAPIEGTCLFREGAFVQAYMEGNILHLVNTLDVPITKAYTNNNCPLPLENNPILPGDARSFPLASRPDFLSAFTGDKEVCVYFAP